MASNNLQAATQLQNGDDLTVFVAAGNKGRIFQLANTAVFTPCQTSLTCREALSGRLLRKITCQDGESKKMYIDAIPDGDLELLVECNLGTCTVEVNELDAATDLVT